MVDRYYYELHFTDSKNNNLRLLRTYYVPTLF